MTNWNCVAPRTAQLTRANDELNVTFLTKPFSERELLDGLGPNLILHGMEVAELEAPRSVANRSALRKIGSASQVFPDAPGSSRETGAASDRREKEPAPRKLGVPPSVDQMSKAVNCFSTTPTRAAS